MQVFYARYAHEFMELRDPLDLSAGSSSSKFDPPPLPRRTAPPRRRGESIALGTATDPYQPAEGRYRITRAILGVFAETSGLRLGITTKSQLVARDIDLFREIAQRHFLTISMTVTTVDAELGRALEPLAPRPDLRLAAVRKLGRNGIRATVFCAPILPLINDSDASLDELARAASAAGAQGFGGNVLFLKPCARPRFSCLSWKKDFRYWSGAIEKRFERTAYLRGDYPEPDVGACGAHSPALWLRPHRGAEPNPSFGRGTRSSRCSRYSSPWDRPSPFVVSRAGATGSKNPLGR